MQSFLYNFFHNETNDRTENGFVRIPKDKNDWPKEWKKIAYKKYSLFRPIFLEQTESFFFKKILSQRRSSTGYIIGNKVTFPILSSILQCGYGLQTDIEEKERKETRTVPSAGQRYPLEIYLFLFRDIDGCEAGIYHYGVKNHTLEPVVFDTFSPEDIALFSPLEWLKDTNGIICITSIFNRVTDKYGSRGYRYVLLEAGHVAQNMLLAGTENNVNIIPIGAVNENAIEKRLGLNISNERVIYTLFL